MLNQTFDYTLPLGINCNSANGLKLAGIRKFKLPFDWMQVKTSKKPETFIQMIENAKNEGDFEIVMNKPGNFSISTFNAWIPHEPINHDVLTVKQNYVLYFKRLIKILNSNSKILVIVTSIEIFSPEIVDIYRNYLKQKFPNNEYYFLTVNIGNKPVAEETWTNIIITERPQWAIINCKYEWTDPYLRVLTDFFRDNVKATNII